MMHMLRLIHFLSLLCFLYGFFIVFRCFALLKGDRSGGTSRQAIAETIAEILPHQLCLPVHDGNSAFVAGTGAESAAVAPIFIDVNDLPNHSDRLLLRPDVIINQRIQDFCI